MGTFARALRHTTFGTTLATRTCSGRPLVTRAPSGQPLARRALFDRPLASCAFLVPVLALFALLVAPPAADAQYFGQNQVRWDQFDFQVLETDHFRIHFYPEAEDAVREAARMAERWHERLARSFTYELPGPNPVVLYANHPDFQQTTVIQGRIGQGTGGVTEARRQRLVMPLTMSRADVDHVLGHEMVHVFQFSIASRGPGLGNLLGQPLWSVEGLAEYLSIGRADPHTTMWIRDAILLDEFPTIDDMSSDPQRYFPYRFGHAFWAFVASEWGDEAAMRMFRQSLDDGMSGAISTVLGTSSDSLSAFWERSMRAAYEPELDGRTPPDEVGDPLVRAGNGGGEMNLAPAVSPDGRYVAFLSERGVFSIELWLADVETGRVIRRLASTETDPHFDALAFIESAGAWSPDGERFAYVALAEGENRIVTVDGTSGGDRQEIEVEGVNAMSHPAWSPDGTRIAFVGQSGGRSDLWMVEPATGEASRLTQDEYSALQPAWSPNGERIVFVTDRGPGTDLEDLEFAPLGLAELELETGVIEPLEVFPTGKAIDPSFSPDGASLYFIADPDGFPDVYRIDTATGDLYRVTRTATGISGLTSRSSALSVASDDGRLAFSIFTGGNYAIHTLAAEEARGERVVPARIARAHPGAIPPHNDVTEGFVMEGLGNPEVGLPPRPEQPAEPYDPDLSLEAIGPLNVGVGTSQFGTAASGSISFLFGDLLRRRNLQVALQAQGELSDIGGQAFYLNERGRWTWGGLVGRTPYRAGFTQVGSGDDGTRQVEQVIQRVAQYQALGIASYPFSRVRRVEFLAGASYYTYDAERWTWDVINGRAGDPVREPAPDFAPPSVDLYQGSAALVGDNSVMGFVSPARGQRWRLEVQPTFGSLDYTTGLIDYRRYFSGRPVTLATRAMHFGRYGADAEGERVSPLFLGSEPLIRGYSTGSFSPTECTPAPDGRCPEFHRLFGSRLAVANFEIRFPVFGVEGYGLFQGSPFPLELGAFADAGVAWTSEEGPEIAWERRSAERVPVTSAGVTTRLGLGQYLAIEVYWAYPFQRPERGGHFGFQIAPGW